MFLPEEKGLKVEAVQEVLDHFKNQESKRMEMLNQLPRWMMEGMQLVDSDRLYSFFEFTADVLKWDSGEAMELFLSTYRAMKENRVYDISVDSFEKLDSFNLMLLQSSFSKITDREPPFIKDILQNRETQQHSIEEKPLQKCK